MYQDNAVEAFSEYYYRVRAVDAAGQKGPFSEEAAVTTTAASRRSTWAGRSRPSRSTAPEYGRVLAIDGNPDPFHAWISKPYGGGTKEKPRDVWWPIEFPGKKTLQIKGVQDHRRSSGDHSACRRTFEVQLLPERRLEDGRRSPRRHAEGHSGHVAAAA